MTRPIKAAIDLSALRHNHNVARRHARGARIWTVVKANAYGHGLLRVARALDADTDGFALIELEGAIALRQAGLRQPILMLEGFYSAAELPLFAAHRLTPTLHSLEQVLAFTASSLPFKLPVYLKLNTGMNRLGLNEDELSVALERLANSPRVESVTLMTHFADADNERGIAWQQANLSAMSQSADRGFALSTCNSAALLGYPDGRGDWVRPGIMLYGGSPFPERQGAAALGLRAVMTLESELIAVRNLQPGDRIGYGGLFTATTPMKIGVVACGYADGYPRSAPTGTPVQICGRRSRTLGRISMDKLCADLTGIDDAIVGSPVLLWGGGKGEASGLPADEVAGAAGTISYELFCALAARVPVLEV